MPVPEVTGPIEGGLFGWPYGFVAQDPEAFGYISEEFFISGTARAADGSQAEYKTRILVLRPQDKSAYRGTVLVEWLNVTGQSDAAPLWYVSHEHIIRDGYAFVGVSAQKAGVDGSPLSLKFWDPVRYGDLRHPGDEYSFDIYSQAAQALKRGHISSLDQPDPLGGYQPRHLLATGQSQSGGRMRTYINEHHEAAGVIDGFLPNTSGVPELRDDLDPVLWVNSEREAAAGVPEVDGGLFVLWEIAGASHFGWWGLQYANAATGVRNRTGPGTGNLFDRESAGQYGEQGGGPCPQNFYPDRFSYNAAIHHLERWVREGIRPPTAPRMARDPLTEELVRDEHGNVEGGLRLPPLDVPVATYTGDRCGLFGDTVQFDPLELSARYPTHEAYVSAMQEATDAAVEAGYMLPPGAAELMRRARESDIGKSVVEN